MHLNKFKRAARQKPKSMPKWPWLVLPLAILLGVIFLTKTGLWDGKSKFSLVMAEGASVRLKILDPKLETITEIILPGETQVAVAGGLGSWKLASVWQLGLNEGQGGALLAKTVAKNFGFPVYAWVGGKNFRQTNLKFGDRVKLKFFELRASPNKRLTLSLADWREFLKEKTLVDGSRGYVISGKVPQKIAVFFADETVASQNLKAKISGQTDTADSAEAVSRVIEMLGVKVAAVTPEETEDFACQVTGTDAALVKLISRIFGCEPQKGAAKSSFDLEIKLGTGFNRNF